MQIQILEPGIEPPFIAGYDPLKNINHETETPDGVDVRALRYGLLPIWDADGLKSDSTYVNFIPSGGIFTFRPFPIEAANRAETGGHSVRAEVTPLNQIIDMETVYGEKGFRSFPDLAKLSEDEAIKVRETIWQKLVCSKYPEELGETCASCRLNDLRRNAGKRIDDTPGLSAKVHQMAMLTLTQLIECLSFGLQQARRDFDIAVNLIKQPQSGKTYLDMPETRAMYHLHETKPELQQVEAAKSYGEQANKELGAEIAKGLGEALNKQGAGETALLLQQLLAQNAEIIAQNNQMRAENAGLMSRIETVTDQNRELTGLIDSLTKPGEAGKVNNFESEKVKK